MSVFLEWPSSMVEMGMGSKGSKGCVLPRKQKLVRLSNDTR